MYATLAAVTHIPNARIGKRRGKRDWLLNLDAAKKDFRLKDRYRLNGDVVGRRRMSRPDYRIPCGRKVVCERRRVRETRSISYYSALSPPTHLLPTTACLLGTA